jgi:opacity protein-like surface antigen
MKKILLFVAVALLTSSVMLGQDDDKKFRFGLRVSPTPTWLRSNDSKLVEKSSTKFGFGFGLQIEIRINSTAHFVTGIGGDFLGGKQSYKNGQGYVLSKDNAYTESEKTKFGTDPQALYNSTQNQPSGNGDKLYEIKSRNIKATYVTLPILLKLMTKDIGGFKYFGMFGGNLAFQTKFRATDEIVELNYDAVNNNYQTGGSSTITDMRPSGDLIPFNFGLNAGIGLEYNLSGSTSAFVSFNYLRGFVNQYQGTSDIMVEKLRENVNTNNIPPRAKQSAFVDGIQINLGMLF